MDRLLKGMFFSEIVEKVRIEKGTEGIVLLEKRMGESCSYSGFKDYPVEKHIKLLNEGINIIYGAISDEAYLAMGRYAWDTFINSPIGKTTIILYAHDFKRGISSIAKLWGLITNFGVRTYEDLGVSKIKVTIKEDPRPAKYIEGVLFQGAEYYKINATILTTVIASENYEFLIEWQK